MRKIKIANQRSTSFRNIGYLAISMGNVMSFNFICKKSIHIFVNKSQRFNNTRQQMSRKYR